MSWTIDKQGYVRNENGNILGVTKLKELPKKGPIPIYQPTTEFVQDLNAQKPKDTRGMSLIERVNFFEDEYRFFLAMLMPEVAKNYLKRSIECRIEKINKEHC